MSHKLKKMNFTDIRRVSLVSSVVGLQVGEENEGNAPGQ